MIEGKLTKEQADRFWKMAYRLNDNVKTYMDTVYKEKNGVITDKEISDLENYKIDGWNGIVRSIVLS